jgi:hypothetical protein
MFVPFFSFQLSVFSYQLSVFSYQLSVFSYQLSAHDVFPDIKLKADG